MCVACYVMTWSFQRVLCYLCTDCNEVDVTTGNSVRSLVHRSVLHRGTSVMTNIIII